MLLKLVVVLYGFSTDRDTNESMLSHRYKSFKAFNMIDNLLLSNTKSKRILYDMHTQVIMLVLSD